MSAGSETCRRTLRRKRRRLLRALNRGFTLVLKRVAVHADQHSGMAAWREADCLLAPQKRAKRVLVQSPLRHRSTDECDGHSRWRRCTQLRGYAAEHFVEPAFHGVSSFARLRPNDHEVRRPRVRKARYGFGNALPDPWQQLHHNRFPHSCCTMGRAAP